MADVITVRSLEDVAYLLNILFFNMNNLSKVYYDMFINPEPMDIELQRYDESGNLVTVTLPNRAKDVVQAYVGNGNPNGIQVAKVGAFYVDLNTTSLYYKSVGSDAYGWVLLYSAINSNFLEVDGDGSQLTNLNASAINSGTLSVNFGGTGNSALNGVLKGNGTSPVSAATDGVDFLGPLSSVGLICFYPVPDIPVGWILCDGRSISRAAYSRLFEKIGTLYGEGNGVTTFNIPNLLGYFIRGWDNTRNINVPQEGAVGGHTHSFAGSTGPGTAHSHTRGTMNIQGSIIAAYDSVTGAHDSNVSTQGAFTKEGTVSNRINYAATSQAGTKQINFDASQNWTGSTSTESQHTHALVGSVGDNAPGVENMVKNIPLFPIIKY